MKTISLTISGMHCVSCALNIDAELEDTKGIKSSNTNYAQQKTKLEFDENLVNFDKIISVIKSIGYEAQIES